MVLILRSSSSTKATKCTGLYAAHQRCFDKIRFLSNRVGTYSWTLFELLRRDEEFDIIYLDGRHAFYFDCSALVLGSLSVEAWGYFFVG
jgi:hypothetical protein